MSFSCILKKIHSSFACSVYRSRNLSFGRVELIISSIFSKNVTKNAIKTFSSDNNIGNRITYSGGQPIKGQGGYYGSGGARASKSSSDTRTDQQRTQMLALATDVEHIKLVMAELELLEHLLQEDQEEHENKVTNRSVELRGAIKHLISNKEFVDCLDRLEVQGTPIWGLSSDEHDLILLAREKINQC